MPKILHTARYTGKPWEILKSVVPTGFTVETLETATYDCLLRQCVDADYLLVSGRLPINEGVLSAVPKLRMIQRTGVGTDMLDLEAIKQHGIPVYVNAGINARSVAEHTITLMLCCLKNIPLISSNVKKGIWKKQETGVSCHELHGKTVGLVGMGAIGKQVATFLKVFGAKVLYTDLFRQTKEMEDQLSLTYVESFQEMLPQIDILSFHCPLTQDNREMLNEEMLAIMKDGAMVVNTARGKLLNEEALFKALTYGKIHSAALDVHYEEPIKGVSKFAAMDNVILTPHIAGLSYESFHAMLKGAVNNIVAYEKGDKDFIKEKQLV